MTSRLRIAVVGAGIAGIAAAHLLAKRHDVTLFERNDYVGGHTNTITVNEPGRAALPVDTGFIICNQTTYPKFYRLLREWGVSLRDTEMSFGYFCEDTGLGYVGPSIRQFLARPSNLLRRGFVGMLLGLRRFNRRAMEDLERGDIGEATLGEYLEQLGVSEYFSRHYLLPIAAAVWSSPDADMLRFPARAFIRFFANHGMLALRHRPRWQTVVGGSQAYVRAFRTKFQGAIRTNSPVTAVTRAADGVTVRTRTSSEKFDRVVLATHADESLSLLTDASPEEARLLSAWTYHRNPTVLHTDATVMPTDRRLWASWNYHRRSGASRSGPLQATYYMNRLQGLKSERDYFVSLNASAEIAPSSIIYSVEFTHPGYSPHSFDAQRGLRDLNGTNRTYYSGSYMGYGFHEDAVASSVDVAGRMGVSL